MYLPTSRECEWGATFPHRVAPFHDEWLVSVLLRCDEVNHWESGTTFRFLLRATSPPGFGPGSSLLVVPMTILEYLAQLLMVSSECLLATTYATELARLYLSPDPSPALLFGLQYNPDGWQRRHRPEARAVATARKTSLCPVCVAQTRTLKRTVTLPHLRYCPIHHVAFQDSCVCSEPLKYFSRGCPPFTCCVCGLDWAQWPQIEMSPDHVALEQELFALYDVFLSVGTEELKASAMRLARQKLKGHEALELKLTGRKLKHPATRGLRGFSLGYAIEILVSARISPSDIPDDDILLF